MFVHTAKIPHYLVGKRCILPVKMNFPTMNPAALFSCKAHPPKLDIVTTVRLDLELWEVLLPLDPWKMLTLLALCRKAVESNNTPFVRPLEPLLRRQVGVVRLLFRKIWKEAIMMNIIHRGLMIYFYLKIV